jgi:hypothetical protein
MKSTVIVSRPASAFTISGGALFSAWNEAVEAELVSTVTRWTQAGAAEVIYKTGGQISALAALANGDLVVSGGSDAELAYPIFVMSRAGDIRAKLDSGFGGRADWLATGGTPEQIFAATSWSCTPKEHKFVAVWDAKTRERSYIRTNKPRPATLSDFGVSRVLADGHVAEWPWKGAVKKTAAKVGQRYGNPSCVRVTSGWLLHDLWAFFATVDGKQAWEWEGYIANACAYGADRLLIMSREEVFVVDAPSGKVLSSCPRALTLSDQQRDRGTIHFDLATNAAFLACEAGIERVEGLPAPEFAAKSVSAQTQASNDTAPTPLDLQIDAFVSVADAICGTSELETLKALHKQLATMELMDVLVASEEADSKGGRAAKKRIAKIQSYRTKSKDLQIVRELENILDTISST